MGIPAGAQVAPTRAAIQSGTGHNVMYSRALAFKEAVWQNGLTSKAKQEPSAVETARSCVTSEAAWRSRASNDESSRALHGDGQRWLSVRLLCRGISAEFRRLLEVGFRRY